MTDKLTPYQQELMDAAKEWAYHLACVKVNHEDSARQALAFKDLFLALVQRAVDKDAKPHVPIMIFTGNPND